MTTGKRISKLRQAKGLTQEYLAQALGVSRQAVSKWENDLSLPDTNHLIALADQFGVSVSDLSTGHNDVVAEKQKCSRLYILGNTTIALYLIPIIINVIGYTTGVFEMFSIPISSRGDRIGIYLGYGESPFAIILLVLEILSVIAAICLTVLYFVLEKQQEACNK